MGGALIDPKTTRAPAELARMEIGRAHAASRDGLTEGVLDRSPRQQCRDGIPCGTRSGPSGAERARWRPYSSRVRHLRIMYDVCGSQHANLSQLARRVKPG